MFSVMLNIHLSIYLSFLPSFPGLSSITPGMSRPATHLQHFKMLLKSSNSYQQIMLNILGVQNYINKSLHIPNNYRVLAKVLSPIKRDFFTLWQYWYHIILMEQQLQLVVRKLYEHILIKKKSSLGFNSQIHFIRSEMPEGLQSQRLPEDMNPLIVTGNNTIKVKKWR